MQRIDSKTRKLVRENLALAEHFILDLIKHPEKLKEIPNGSTVILYPVPVRTKKAA